MAGSSWVMQRSAYCGAKIVHPPGWLKKVHIIARFGQILLSEIMKCIPWMDPPKWYKELHNSKPWLEPPGWLVKCHSKTWLELPGLCNKVHIIAQSCVENTIVKVIPVVIYTNVMVWWWITKLWVVLTVSLWIIIHVGWSLPACQPVL